jgi:CubicO group peptidase (beta-lactamase class C family)
MNDTFFKQRFSRRTFVKHARLSSLSLLSTVNIQAQGEETMNEESQRVLGTTDALAQASMTDGLVPGMAVVVVQNQEIFFSKGYGYANSEQHLPFTERTSIQIGSTSKNLTGFAVAQLLERGSLELDAPVKSYLPTFKVADPKSETITVRHLLAQTSGLPATEWVYERTIVNDEPEALETLVRSLATVKLNASPGERYEYSNYNYAVLGLLVQTVSAMSYEAYMSKCIFEPLGMTRTLAPTNKNELPSTPELSRGYQAGSTTSSVECPILLARQWNSSGLIISNAEDIGKYLLAQLNGGRSVTGQHVLSAASLELSHQGLAEGESTLGGSMHYAFGWETAVKEGIRIVEHGGDGRTSGSYFLLLPDQGIGVAVLLNLVDYGKVQLTYQIAKTLLGLVVEPYQSLPRPDVIPVSTFKPNTDVWQDYQGEYDTVRGRLEVFLEDSQLKMRLAKGTAVEEVVRLEAQSTTDFITRSNVLASEGIAFSFQVTSEGTLLHYDARVYPRKIHDE